MDNEFLLFDRLEKIRSTIKEYGEKNFSISFSGGKDSCVLSALIDEALPGNEIPRVYVNTGIEYNEMVKFVKSLRAEDDRIVILPPSVNIKEMLEKEGYPFKSKQHSKWLSLYQRKGLTDGVMQYLQLRDDKAPWDSRNSCPKLLRYQFTDAFTLLCSDRCCLRMKEEPLDRYSKEHRKLWQITGLMRDEGGRRKSANCVNASKTKSGLSMFNPLAPMTKEWEDWYVDSRKVKTSCLYSEPFNFERTGCKGCPFTLHLQEELDTIGKFFPEERRQCEYIWAPVYSEYRRLGYRLRKTDEEQQIEWWEVTK